MDDAAQERQRANDAELEAAAWKQTATRWRKRALRDGGHWRVRCAELERRLDDANERGAGLAEELGVLKEQCLTKAASKALRAELKEANGKLAIVNRYEAWAEQARAEASRERDAAARAHALRDKASKENAAAIEQMRLDKDRTVAALRVVANRVGVDWKDEALVAPLALAAAIDAALVALASK